MGLKPDPRQGLAFTVDGEKNDSKVLGFFRVEKTAGRWWAVDPEGLSL
jgi:hypothetical protein